MKGRDALLNSLHYSAALYLLAAVVVAFMVDKEKLDHGYFNGYQYNRAVVRLNQHADGTQVCEKAFLNSAAAYFEQFAEMRKNSSVLWANAGLCYYYLGNYKEAAQLLRKAIGLRPDAYDFYRDLGLIYLKAKRFSNASEIFNILKKQDAVRLQQKRPLRFYPMEKEF